MKRVRFLLNMKEVGYDYRTAIWPKYPYWCSGETFKDFVMVAYIESEKQLYEQWPEAKNMEVLENDCVIKFSERFSRPDWYKESEVNNG